MRIVNIRCDWCGDETEYDDDNHTEIIYTRWVSEWVKSHEEKYDVCKECRNLFSKLILERMQLQKVDAE